MAEGNFFPGPTAEEIIVALGYTPENVANKATDFSVINDTKYPTTEATNNQIIASLSSVSSYFFYKTASDIATYYQMTAVAPTGGPQSFTGTGLAVGEHVLASFVTNSGYPNKTFYPSGWTTGHIHAEKAGSGVVTLRMDTYKRAVGGTETLICSSDLSTALTTSPTAYNFDAYNATLDTLLTSDRIVTKVVAVVASGTPNVTIYVEDAYLSRTNLPIQQTLYSDYFYNGIYASKPDPSTLADGITAWFTDKPDSNGGSFVVRSTATPGTKIWDRVGGGPVAIDTWANCNLYDLTAYAGCTFRVTDIGVTGFDFISVGGKLRMKNLSGAGQFIYSKPFDMSLAYILLGGGSLTWSRAANGLITWTKASHGLTSEFNGATCHVTQGTLSTGSTNITTGWGFTNFTYVDANTFTTQSTVLEAGTGSAGSNTSKTYLPFTYTYPLNLIDTGDAVGFELIWRRCSNSANNKTLSIEYSGIVISVTARATSGTNWVNDGSTSLFYTASNKFLRSTLFTSPQTDTNSTFTLASTLTNATDWDLIMPVGVTYTPRSPV